MPCKHPLKGWQVGFHPSGKPKYYISSYNTLHVEINQAGQPVSCFTDVVSPYAKKVIRDFIEIPCGRCVSCRLSYSRQWADRCMLELGYHESSYFVTLTYDDDHLPINEYIDSETGVIGTSATLVKRDMQLFFKRLRKNYKYDNKLRYYYCGEYGSQSMRPHYHAIIFGLKLDDLVLYKSNGLGQKLYNSEFLQRCWQDKGYVVVGEVTWDSCAYVARYVLKKQYGSAAEIYERMNILPEFTQMSLKPAIGRRYYDEHKDEIFKYDKIHVSTPTGGRGIRPPKYFERLYDIDYPEDSKLLKEQRRQAAEIAVKLKLSQTSDGYEEMLRKEELAIIDRVKRLPRKEI